jgi:tetratricopeptide (TPR) repeat protein
MADKKTFFISYTTRSSYDISWAKWLESAIRKLFDCKTIMQEYDFKPGDNFKARMDNALKEADTVIGVFTQTYSESTNCRDEWTNADHFIPILVDSFKPQGLLKSVVYIDLFDKTEQEALNILQTELEKAERPIDMAPYPTWKKERIEDNSSCSFPTFRMRGITNLFGRNPYFSGREKILADISDAFLQFPVVELAGQGGYGKSQIAVEYAYRHIYDYDYIWLFNAESRLHLENSYREFAFQIMDIEDDVEITFEVIYVKIQKWLLLHPFYLFIYDNAEGCQDLYMFLPHGGHLLIITREKLNEIKAMKRLDIDIFSSEDAISFLTKRLEEHEVEEEKRLIASTLGHLPLALEQSVAYMIEGKCSISKYLNLLERNGLKLFNSELAKVDYGKTILTTWVITFEKIAQEDSLQAALLFFKLLVYCEPDNIPLQMFIKGHKGLPPILSEIMDPNCEMEQDDLIGKLLRYSLLSLRRNSKAEQILSVHRLMQKAVVSYIGGDKQFLQYCFAMAIEACDFEFDTKEHRDYFIHAYPHLAQIAEKMETTNSKEATEQVSEIYARIGYGLDQMGDYPEALKYDYRALSIREKILGEEHPDTATIYNYLALVYVTQGDYPKSLMYHQKALKIREKVLGAEHPDTIISYNNIAGVYYAQGDYIQALEYYHMALAINKKILVTDHPYMAFNYNNLSLIYRDQGDYTNALEYAQKALEIREKVLGAAHPDTATAYNNMALVLFDQRNYSEALVYYKKSLEIAERILGTDHTNTATVYNNIAAAYQQLGDHHQALMNYEKALEIRTKVFGVEHPSTASSYNNIAQLYFSDGDYDKALDYYKKAQEICEKVLGIEHPHTACVYNNIAQAYYSQNNKAEALKYYQKSLVICDKVFGVNHPKTLLVLDNVKICEKTTETRVQSSHPQRLEVPYLNTYGKKVGRNEPCPCGSGKKYKQCCGRG